jgi:hypothetical protein
MMGVIFGQTDMAKRVIGICDAALPVPDRERLPVVLCEALEEAMTELQCLGFETENLEPFRWIWEWNPDFDAPFDRWITGRVVSLFWPDAEGITVAVSNHAAHVITGVRWDRFEWDEQVRNAVAKIVRIIGHKVGAKKAWLVPDAGDSAATRAQDLFFESASSADLSATLKNSASTRSVEC